MRSNLDSEDSWLRRGEFLPLTQHLREFWKDICKGDHDLSFTNRTHCVVRWNSAPDVATLLAAAEEVVRTHPVMGEVLTESPAGEALVASKPKTEINFVVRQLSTDEDASIQEIVHGLVWSPMRHQAQFHRFFVVTSPSGLCVLGIVLHHFIGDRKSVIIAFNEWVTHAIQIKYSGAPMLLATEDAFVHVLTDPRDRRTHPDFARERRYWLKETDSLVDTDIHSSAVSNLDSEFRDTNFELEHIGILRDISLKENISPLSLLVTAHARAQQKVYNRKPSSVLLVDGRPISPRDRRVGNYNGLKPLNMSCCSDIIKAAREIHARRLLGMRFHSLPYEIFGDLYYQARVPQLPLINFFDTGPTPAETVASRPAQMEPFDVGPPPAVPTKDNEFEAYYLQLQLSQSVLRGFVRASPRLLSDSTVGALVDAFLEEVAALCLPS